jgi:cytochrome c oxidase subunit 2
MTVTGGPSLADVVLAGTGGVRAPAEVFNSIYVVFLALGTLVSVVVITYILYNAYKYRYRADEDPDPEADRPELGELPESGGKGKKLFLSFGLSAIIVLSLVVWTYASLIYVETQPATAAEQGDEMVNVEVEGYQFGWDFVYPNGHTSNTLRVPQGQMVNLTVTSRDVFHNFGIPELRVKSDAIPGQTTNAWFIAEETGTYQANCYELCGQGHSYMTADVVVMNETAYEEWYASTNATDDGTGNATSMNATGANATATPAGSVAVGGGA